ncbi:MAG TPA: folylpolyglutamate synthase/dihydrofolate synthase family protein [Candidatus Methylomirabilis sp.]|nr:folylpolyglutamate synthase/dihydrofolate synthase family protein [Candidatus Methylomirabilis sp.]
MTYREAVARILALRGGEISGMRPGLDRIEALLAAIGNPERAFRIVQVGGTNGKGSVSAMVAAILEADGHRVGLYTSPHLSDFRERIRVNGTLISETDVVDGVEAIGTLVARLDATMFEAATALGLDHFAREGVDVAVLEVGLGGRGDATTVGEPAVEVLSQIDFDHQAHLGNTLTQIAAEKAAIIRTGVAFAARQGPEVEEVLIRRAAEAGVPLALEGRELRVHVKGFDLGGHRLNLEGPGWSMHDVRCRLLGLFQPGNALLAVAAARQLGASEAAIRRGLLAVDWPGRFQIVQRDPIVVVDGAHNPAGARALAASLRAYFPHEPLTLVIGISADKDQAGILAALAPLAVRIVLTAYQSPRAARPGAMRALLPPSHAQVEIAESLRDALSRAMDESRTPVICVAGSLYLIGEALALCQQGPRVS